MILTGSAIQDAVNKKDITIFPFSKLQLNPNSYNYRLGDKIKVYSGIKDNEVSFEEKFIPESGLILEKRTLYLGHTHEIIGSDKYAMSLIGRSSLGRLGLFLQLSANLGHTTSKHRWTLEIFPLLTIKVFPRMIIGQVSFWKNSGKIETFNSAYVNSNEPKESNLRNIL